MLEVDYRGCAKEPDDATQFAMGINLLDIGIPELTPKTLNEALCRLRFACTIQGNSSAYPTMAQMFRDCMGIKANVPAKTWAQFTSGHTKYFRSIYGPR